MEAKTTKDNLRGLIGTIVFHGILLAMLLLLALHTPLPLPQEAGVEVNIGNSDDGMGDIQPETPAAAAQAAPAPQSAKPDELVTQNTEEAPAIEPVKKEKPVPVEKPQPKPQPKPEPKPEPQPVVNQNAMFKGMKGGTGSGGNQGITGKPGDQGKPNGTPGASNYDGNGGAGGGVSFSLEGRSKQHLPSPSNNFRDRGIVVVTIFVNRQGNVTRILVPAKGTTTTNQDLIRLASDAARKARFSAKEDAPEEQKGSITYVFELN